MSSQVIADDFEKRYAYRPLLIESFVDTSQYTGASYKAANWIEVGTTKGRGRQDQYSEVVGGEGAKVKGYYRLIDKPETSAVSMESIMAPHRERTIRRMMGQKTVLCIQDCSELNYTNLEQSTGLGILKANQTGAQMRGLRLHSTFTVAPNGVPLGVLKAQAQAPQPKDPEDPRRPPVIPIEEKKSFLWIEHHRNRTW